jgi:Do/DeqQ family serine protease
MMLASLVLAMLTAFSAGAANPTLREIENAFIEIGERIRPSVVNIDVERPLDGEIRKLEEEGRLPELFRFFGVPEGEGAPRLPQPVASGSGFIYSEEGHIVTNHHVVQNASRIEVRLYNGDRHEAELIASDPQTDIAVVQIDADDTLRPARLGDSSTLRVGQFAIAVGNPQGLAGSMSFGHVTALEREREDNIDLPGIRFLEFIQTDAAINLGNSGGPLCNIDGEVIGINVAVVRWADALGFAIPINTAKKVLPELISRGRVTRGYLGVHIENAAQFADVEDLPDRTGAYVINVVPGSPADEADIEVYDVIRRVNGRVVEDRPDLQRKIADLQPGETAELEILRDGEFLSADVVLAEMPADDQEAVLGPSVYGLRVDSLSESAAEDVGLDAGASGVIVTSVDANSPAERAGIQPGDVILEVAKEPVENAFQFQRLVEQNAAPGEALLVRLLRSDSRIPRIVALEIPDNGGEENLDD